MSYTVAKVGQDAANSLMDADLDVYVDIASGDFYTYLDVAEDFFKDDPEKFEEGTMPTSVNAGTYPIKPNRRMFPRL